ncbi:immunity 26/phosphotriesterase HocA family protein [Paraflavisolibacter sp. H34]|uniref:immunity 26/phosphotriesterase HocA family protein n=1 Tax=Huijunlia imazamoxiresistens TaxID=3127457 RepID=UPI00301884C3
MRPYELTNDQRRYFGLTPVADQWDRVVLSDIVIVYFHKNKVVKVLSYEFGYLEYDTDIDTEDRKILLPKTARGRPQNLTISRLLKIKGCGVQFSGSFWGGGMTVYDNRRNLFFIKSFPEDGSIQTYQDIDNWIANYIRRASKGNFEWLDKQLTKKRLTIKVKEGDFIAFKIGHNEYGFARILLDVYKARKENLLVSPRINYVHPRSLLVAPYAYYANSLDIDLDAVAAKKTLPSLFIFDLDVYRGEMPVVGHKPLGDNELRIPYPAETSTAITIPYSKTDIETFIATNGASLNA